MMPMIMIMMAMTMIIIMMLFVVPVVVLLVSFVVVFGGEIFEFSVFVVGVVQNTKKRMRLRRCLMCKEPPVLLNDSVICQANDR